MELNSLNTWNFSRGKRSKSTKWTLLLFAIVGTAFLASCSADQSTSFATGTPDVDLIETFLSPEGNNPFLDEDDIEDYINANPGNRDAAEGVADLIELGFQFDTTDIGSRTESFVPNSDEFELRIPMVETSLAGNISEDQVQRPTLNDSFVQNPDTSSVVDSFMQKDDEKTLDILVVIDNSGSMQTEQVNLSSKLSALLVAIEDTDWRIQVTTTDESDDCLVMPDFISSTDPDREAKFAAAVSQGIEGSGRELGILKMVRGFEGCAGYQQWRRPNSNVAALIVSDEDNCSANGAHCRGVPWSQTSYATDYLNQIGVLGVTAKVHGLFAIPGEVCSTAFNVGTQYNELVDLSGGTKGTICSDDYAPTLNAISADLNENLNTSFALSQNPVAGSLVVRVNGVVQTSGYAVTGNAVEFAQAPAKDVSITFSYDVNSAVGPITNKPLSSLADSQSVEVFVDGIPAPNSDYTYNVDDNRVYFFKIPSAGQQVLIQYLGSPLLLKKEFELTHSDVRDLSVMVSGSPVSPGSYSVDSTGSKDKIIFNSASVPADGTLVEAHYRHSHVSILEYDANLSSVNLETVSNNTGDIPFQETNSGIAIASADFMVGSDLVLKGRTTPGSSTQLSASPLLGSVQAMQSFGNTCSTDTGLEVDGEAIDFSGCVGSDPLATWTVSYQYVAEHRLSYDLQAELAEYAGQAKAWIVSVNGAPTVDYALDDNDAFSFESLPLSAVIDVEVFIFPPDEQ